MGLFSPIWALYSPKGAKKWTNIGAWGRRLGAKPPPAPIVSPARPKRAIFMRPGGQRLEMLLVCCGGPCCSSQSGRPQMARGRRRGRCRQRRSYVAVRADKRFLSVRGEGSSVLLFSPSPSSEDAIVAVKTESTDRISWQLRMKEGAEMQNYRAEEAHEVSHLLFVFASRVG